MILSGQLFTDICGYLNVYIKDVYYMYIYVYILYVNYITLFVKVVYICK